MKLVCGNIIYSGKVFKELQFELLKYGFLIERVELNLSEGYRYVYFIYPSLDNYKSFVYLFKLLGNVFNLVLLGVYLVGRNELISLEFSRFLLKKIELISDNLGLLLNLIRIFVIFLLNLRIKVLSCIRNIKEKSRYANI